MTGRGGSDDAQGDPVHEAVVGLLGGHLHDEGVLITVVTDDVVVDLHEDSAWKEESRVKSRGRNLISRWT